MKSTVASLIRSRGYMLASVAISVAFLGLAIRGVDWRALLGDIDQANPFFLVLGALGFCFSYFFRGLRWRAVLSAARPVSANTAFWATMVGYLGNNFLPARAGELLRSVLLGKRERISTSFVVATALTERLADIVALSMMSIIAIGTLQSSPTWLRVGSTVVAVPGAAGVVGLIVLPRLKAPMSNSLARLPLPLALRSRIDVMLDRFLLGLQALHDLRRASLFLGLTLAIWLIDVLAALAIGRAFQVGLTFPIVLLVLAAIGIASAVPSTPGSIGIWQLVAVTTLGPFGYSREASLVFVSGIQVINLLVVLVLGLIGLWLLNHTASVRELVASSVDLNA